MNKFIIVDWVNNIMFNGIEFNTFQDGWDYIYQNIEDVNNSYDDVFVIKKSDLKK